MSYIAIPDDVSMRDDEILNYCELYLDHMWAARITAIILCCDFKDAKQALIKYKKEYNLPTRLTT